MSSISATASIASQPPVAYTPPPPPRQEPPAKAEADKLAATAVKAQVQKSAAPKQVGDLVDIKV